MLLNSEEINHYHKLLENIFDPNFSLVKSFSSLPKDFQALLTTNQDPDFHAEGNVLLHTEMVCQEVFCLAENLEFNKKIVLLAALFHDIAKSYTTKFDPQINHIIAPTHERLGGIQTRYILHHSKLSPIERRAVSSLVATHHLVKRIVLQCEENNPKWKNLLYRVATQTRTKLLYCLELADMRGRICLDQNRQIEIVELFKMLCEEENCFGYNPQSILGPESLCTEFRNIQFTTNLGQKYAWQEADRRFLAGDLDNEYQALSLAHQLSNHNPTEVTILVGLPGSGKSTWVKNFTQYHSGYRIISPDLMREKYTSDFSVAYSLALEELKNSVRSSGQRIIWDATNCHPDTRAKVTGLCHAYNAYIKMIVFDLSLEECLKRNENRENSVPKEVIFKMAQKFELPIPGEYHELDFFDS